MIETAYNPNEFRAQGLFNRQVDDPPPADLIECDATAADQERAASDPEDRSVDLCAISEYRHSIRMTGREPTHYENYPSKSAERRSPVSHGGARKRDDRDSGGDGPPGTAPPNLSPRDLAGCTGSMTDDPHCYTGVVFYDDEAFARVEGDNPDSFAGETIAVAEWRDGRRLLARLGKLDDFSRGYDGDDDSALYRIVAVTWGRNDDAIAS